MTSNFLVFSHRRLRDMQTRFRLRAHNLDLASPCKGCGQAQSDGFSPHLHDTGDS